MKTQGNTEGKLKPEVKPEVKTTPVISQPTNNKSKLIVIDPGHGGKVNS